MVVHGSVHALALESVKKSPHPHFNKGGHIKFSQHHLLEEILINPPLLKGGRGDLVSLP